MTCLECEEYDHEKNYCPLFCEVIRGTLSELKAKIKSSGSGYQCFHCGQNTVYWSGDFTFEDYGYDGEGIIQECHCYNCGADIRYMIPVPDIEEDDTYVGLTD